MDIHQNAGKAVLTALICTALSSGTAWAATPQITPVDVQELSQVQGLVTDGQTKKKSVESESQDANGNVTMSIADAGSQAAKEMQAQKPVQESAHEQAWDIMRMPMRWQAADQALAEREAEETAAKQKTLAKPEIVTAGNTAPSAASQAAAPAHRAEQPAAAVQKPAAGQTVHGSQKLVEVEEPAGTTKPIILTARDLPKVQREQVLRPQKPERPAYQPVEEKQTAQQPAHQPDGSTTIGQQPSESVHPETNVQPKPVEPMQPVQPTQEIPPVTETKPEHHYTVHPVEPGMAAQLPQVPEKVRDARPEDRPEPFRTVSEATWRHIQAGIFAMEFQLRTNPTEHGMYELAQMLNANTGLTRLQKLNYLIGFGYAINHSSLSDWQKGAFIDTIALFFH